MMPAELMTAAVPVDANTMAKPSHLVDQLLAGHPGQIFVHRVLC